MLVADTDRKDTFTKVFEGTGALAWERNVKPRPVQVRGNFPHQVPLLAVALPLPGRLSPPWGPRAARPARAPVGSHPQHLHEHLGVPGSQEGNLLAFPELRSASARAEVVRLTCPGCGAARRQDHLYRSVARGAS